MCARSTTTTRSSGLDGGADVALDDHYLLIYGMSVDSIGGEYWYR